MSDDIIPTAEEAAVMATDLRDFFRPGSPLIVDDVLSLLDAIAAGRVFEVRPERCAECDGVGGFEWIDDHDTGTDTCPRCNGSGYEPAPPGRKQRTAYD